MATPAGSEQGKDMVFSGHGAAALHSAWVMEVVTSTIASRPGYVNSVLSVRPLSGGSMAGKHMMQNRVSHSGDILEEC